MYLETESKWVKLLNVLKTQKVIGLDSEFHGVDFSSGDSCVNLAKLDLWSVAVFSGEWSPRNYSKAKGASLPPEALPYFKEVLEDSSIIKVCHNSPVDFHCFKNAGVEVTNIVNTLSMARWIVPGRDTYNLDDLSIDYLGAGKSESFKSLFTGTRIIEVPVEKKIKVCICNEPGCRKRKFPHDNKWEQVVTSFKEKEESFLIPIYTVRPGHELFERYRIYAEVDAVRALELYDYLLRRGTQLVEIPWY